MSYSFSSFEIQPSQHCSHISCQFPVGERPIAKTREGVTKLVHGYYYCCLCIQQRRHSVN